MNLNNYSQFLIIICSIVLLFTVNLPEPGVYTVIDDSRSLNSQSKQLRAQVNYLLNKQANEYLF